MCGRLTPMAPRCPASERKGEPTPFSSPDGFFPVSFTTASVPLLPPSRLARPGGGACAELFPELLDLLRGETCKEFFHLLCGQHAQKFLSRQRPQDFPLLLRRQLREVFLNEVAPEVLHRVG